MGFLGIMQDPDGAPFCVPELNVNLWVLPGLLGRRVVYLEVGIHLQAPSEAALTSFILLLPGGTEEQPVDLADPLSIPRWPSSSSVSKSTSRKAGSASLRGKTLRSSRSARQKPLRMPPSRTPISPIGAFSLPGRC